MALQSKQIFVNLPVKDLNKTKEFFKSIGYEFNAQFTDEKAACMVIGDNIYAMLLVESFFQTFIKKEITDASKQTEVIVALSADSREQVDEIANKAAAAGAKGYEPVDHGFMYSRSFEDLDGHLWEYVYMDMSAAQ
jgi:uncharacterized protein